MKHTDLTDEDRERAALYALGALDTAEGDAFTAHLEGGCTVCAAEVAALSGVAGDLALAARPTAPPPSVWSRVLGRIDDPAPSGFHFRLRRDGAWRLVEPGVSRRDLGPATFLVRVQAGSRVARHEHATVEHCYVLEGDLRVGDRHLHAGDYHEAAAGSVHDELATDQGCLLLIVESGAAGAPIDSGPPLR